MPSIVLFVQLESTVRQLLLPRRQTAMLEHFHGVARNSVLHAPVAGSAQTGMELEM